ncbi:MAG: alkaline phosphatase family protein [Deltaproteobacteria bacterium]|nr:alkaline phosphatase family protein [Deltaproteobacteria bacterium]
MGLFDKLMKSAKPRAVVVGLDGVPYTMLKDLKARGLIPNMGEIFDAGYFGQMSVCIPEISSVSWSSFMTGIIIYDRDPVRRTWDIRFHGFPTRYLQDVFPQFHASQSAHSVG